ncbi:hypothetical protein IMCC3317_17910 [Kordia antarctica]|uniref:Uncharacterized protein n=1 Tax=Kordia antarctica TaxID=1218801 RepID=A0A7L4ZI69_9FLAO|nr:hypothetical protein [Kordia antarctica]QHI36428.1 hypothetical protein IMCC3317_17910 [Kordia antarctica]
MSKKFTVRPKKFVMESGQSNIDPNIFEKIIRTVSSNDIEIDENYERLIIVNDKTGEPFYQKNFTVKVGSFLGKKYSYHIINFIEFSKVENLLCEISDPREGTTIKLKLSFELSCIKGKGIKVIQFLKKNKNASEAIHKIITSWIRNFIEAHPNFTNDFFRLEEELRTTIIYQAERKGFRIRGISFAPIGNRNKGPLQHITIVHATKCQIFDDHIEVRNKIVVNLINVRAYSWKNIDDPETWIKQKADAIIQNELIDKSFKDIVDEFKSGYRRNISSKLDEAVREIGYSIQHIISIPSEEIADFLDGFVFNLGDQDTFETSEAEIKIKLSVTIEGKGTKLNGIDKKYIKPRKSIIDDVQKMTLEIVRKELRNVDPAKYYKEFNDVSNSLKATIKKQLIYVFKLDQTDLKVSISFLNTDLKERFDKLYAERGIVKIESKTKNTHYEIKYGVQVVNDWHVFHKNHIKYFGKTIEEYKDISDHIKNEIELEVKRVAGFLIEAAETRKLDYEIGLLFENTQHIITEEFGLQLKAPRLKRVSHSDLNDNDVYAMAFLEQREQIKEELKLALMEDDDDLVDELTKKLKKSSDRLKGISNTDSKLIITASDTKKIGNNGEE